MELIKIFIEIGKKWGVVGVLCAYFLIQDYNSRSLDRELSRESIVTLKNLDNNIRENNKSIAGLNKDVKYNKSNIEDNKNDIEKLRDLKIADLLK